MDHARTEARTAQVAEAEGSEGKVSVCYNGRFNR